MRQTQGRDIEVQVGRLYYMGASARPAIVRVTRIFTGYNGRQLVEYTDTTQERYNPNHRPARVEAVIFRDLAHRANDTKRREADSYRQEMESGASIFGPEMLSLFITRIETLIDEGRYLSDDEECRILYGIRTGDYVEVQSHDPFGRTGTIGIVAAIKWSDTVPGFVENTELPGYGYYDDTIRIAYVQIRPHLRLKVPVACLRPTAPAWTWQTWDEMNDETRAAWADQA